MKTTSTSRRKTVAWNKGARVGQKLALSPREIRAIRRQLTSAEQLRDLALFGVAIDGSLRSCDLLCLHVREVARRGQVASKVKVRPRNMNNAVEFEISGETQNSLAEWIAYANLKPSDYLFASRLNDSPHISSRQYARIVVAWIAMIGLDPEAYGTESLRRTGPALAYKRTGDLDVVQALLGHSKRETTRRFLGLQSGASPNAKAVGKRNAARGVRNA